MQASLIRLKVQEREGFDRRGEAIRIGVPLRRGAVFDSRSLVLRDGSEEQLPLQCRPLARWIDGSIKWLLLDAVLNVSARGESDLALQISADQPPHHSPLTCRATTGQIEIDTGSARFTLPSQGSGLLSAFNDAGSLFVDARDTCVRVTGVQNAQWQVELGLPQIEDQGSVRVTVLREGRAFSPGAAQLRLKLRFTFLVNTSAVQLDVEAWNPRAAIHPGGMWDLGDPNSIHFRDLSIDLAPAHPGPASRWRSEPFLEEKSANTPLVIHQNSSGGENWNSSNHVDASGNLTVTFAGYRVTDADGTVLESGKRASPYLAVQSPAGTTSVGVQQFWQNFPKSLRWSGQKLSIGLFPEESSQTFELQPGEKKRHSVMLDFTRRGEPSRLRQLQQPVAVSLDPEAVAATAAVGYLVPQSQDPNAAYLAYLDTILDGQHSFLAKRELIDEFGWRNFGDLYADHEAVHHKDSKPFISHYNNQYDFIYGAGFHFLRSGDVRWFQLMRDAARHVVDIDIYHTDGDKTGFSGGLFWHTDHYKDAFTCTHRTYSKHNAEGSYGGGPSNEHNYTSGLLLYHWLTGDPEARAAVCELAEWVIAMDDGSRTLFGLIDEGPTGLASKSRDADFHKPGRGAGNSINALLDAHAVTGSRRFMQKAEELIQRVIHPADEVDRLELDQPETRW